MKRAPTDPSSLSEREGLIKFASHHTSTKLSLLPLALAQELLTWRDIFRARGVVGGGDLLRYHGDGYGNLSARVSSNDLEQLNGPEASSNPRDTFLITGSQTGHKETLDLCDLALVQSHDLHTGMIRSSGEILPSSESLTHATLYQLSEQIKWVFHVHSAPLWQARHRLALPRTPDSVSYGTVEMAHAARAIYQSAGEPKSLLIAMDGHQDGLISFGPSAQVAGEILLNALNQTEGLSL